MKATVRHKLIDRVKKLEGLTDDERSALLGLLRESKTYGLVWEDHTEEVEKRLSEELPVLKEVKHRAIVSDNPDAPNHVLIEGDNLEALSTLAYTHARRIDVIYIDPPYNTGNKDFIYNDSYVDSEDDFRHSKWLSFMSKRLRLAKQLLSDRGVIFISIDDNEQANLKLLCDEIFGPAKFLGLITRLTGTTTGQDTGSLGKAADYILCYSKNEGYQIGGIPLTQEDLNRYNMQDEKGNFSILQLRRTGGEDRREDRPTMFFPIIAPDGTEVYPYGPSGYESRWRVGPEKVKKMVAENLLYFKKDKTGVWKVYYKFYAENKTKRPSNVWNEIDGNKKAQIELRNILGEKTFDTPKPLQLVCKILELTSTKKSIVLDFFAGSGTTLHAVMKLNDEDGGRRQCILVTNNENGICENVTYERNRRVIEGYTKPNGEAVAGLKDNSLRYYTTDFISRSQSMRNMQRLAELSTDMLCIKENLYAEQPTMAGIKTHPRVYRYFDDGKKRMLIIYREEYIEQIVKLIEKMRVEEPMRVYVFSPSDDPATDLFETVADKVVLTALPAAIYNTYRRILPKQADKVIAVTETQAEDDLGGLFKVDNQ